MGRSAEGLEKKRFLSDLFGKPESLSVLLSILFYAILFGAGLLLEWLLPPYWHFPVAV